MANIITDGLTGDVYTTPFKTYAAVLSQTGTSAPIPAIRPGGNTIGGGTWVRQSEGVYYNLTTTDFDSSKIFIASSWMTIDSAQVTTAMIPYYDDLLNVLTGFWRFSLTNEGDGKITMWVFSLTADGDPIDIGGRDVPDKLGLPDFRVYP